MLQDRTGVERVYCHSEYILTLADTLLAYTRIEGCWGNGGSDNGGKQCQLVVVGLGVMGKQRGRAVCMDILGREGEGG